PTNTQFSLAVHVLTLLGSQSPALVSSDFLSASANTSPEHVRRVLAPLRRAGLVRSRPGPSGGWQLAGAGCETTLGDIRRGVRGERPVTAASVRPRAPSRAMPTRMPGTSRSPVLERSTTTGVGTGVGVAAGATGATDGVATGGAGVGVASVAGGSVPSSGVLG